VPDKQLVAKDLQKKSKAYIALLSISLYIYIVLLSNLLNNVENEFIRKWKSQVKKGTLSFIALNALSKKELYGYELIELIKESTSIVIAEGTLYPLMNRLKKEGLATSKWVEQESGIPRKYYVLTKEGLSTLKEMRGYWDELELSIKKITKNEL